MTHTDQTARHIIERSYKVFEIESADGQSVAIRKDVLDALRDLALQVAPPVTEGWKSVPVDPTEGMIIEAATVIALDPKTFKVEDIYRAMLKATPEPQPSADVSEDEREALRWVRGMTVDEVYNAGANAYILTTIINALTRAKSGERVEIDRMRKAFARAALCVFTGGHGGITDTAWMENGMTTLYEHLVGELDIEVTGDYDTDLFILQQASER